MKYRSAIISCLYVPALVLALSFQQAARAQSSEDQAWLARVAYGAQPAALSTLEKSGRKAFLDQQLAPPPSDDLPSPVQKYIDGLSTTQLNVEQAVAKGVENQQALIKIKNNPAARSKANIQYNKARQQAVQEAGERHLLRAVYSPWQLREQMAWFWFNHFNVFQGKAQVGFTIASYEDALRPYLLGNFRDLLMASLKHPAMQQYLDNYRSNKKKPNENYARELMELHTLGVDGGYSQADVQALSRILTGVGFAMSPKKPKLPNKLASQYVRDGAFEFNPNRHDYGEKKFLGHTIKGQGWAEIEQVVDILVSHPATAHHISSQLAIYFIGDKPPEAVVTGAAKVFHDTKGDIAATVRYLLESNAFAKAAGSQFKSPMRYVVSSLQLADIKNPKRAANIGRASLYQSGESLYGRVTPDGYSLIGDEWVGSGQLATRLAIAQRISGLQDAASNKAQEKQAASEKLFLQLTAPEFMYR